MQRITPNKILMLFLGCVLSASLGFVLASPSGTRFTMSDSEMANMIGGQCPDCNDCNTTGGNATYRQCVSLDPNSCSSSLCMKHIINSASCKANQGDAATGCDTDLRVPYADMHMVTLYTSATSDCNSTVTASHTWLTIYHGCDTSDGHWCHTKPFDGRCDVSSCPGTTMGAVPMPDEHAYECGC
jgi:hypothetical protein